MPYETGDYKELHRHRNAILYGVYVGMPRWAADVLRLQITFVNKDNGWVYVGARKAKDYLGINSEHWLQALRFLGTNGFYEKWGWAKTDGRPAMAFLLDLGVPTGKVTLPKMAIRKQYHYSSGKDNKLTLPLLVDYLTTKIGQPYHWSEIKTCININKPKEPLVVSQPKKTKEDPLLRELTERYPEYEKEIKQEWKEYIDKGKNKDKAYGTIKYQCEYRRKSKEKEQEKEEIAK